LVWLLTSPKTKTTPPTLKKTLGAVQSRFFFLSFRTKKKRKAVEAKQQNKVGVTKTKQQETRSVQQLLTLH
jgi:hypothetical protein